MLVRSSQSTSRHEIQLLCTQCCLFSFFLAPPQINEQMLPNKLMKDKQIKTRKRADRCRSFPRLNRPTAHQPAPLTLLQICPPSFEFSCSGNNCLGQPMFNTKRCESAGTSKYYTGFLHKPCSN